jgi:SRSO17 transposase
VAEWSKELERLHRRIAPRFYRSEVRARSRRYLEGLLSQIRRKNGWQVAEHAKEKTPDGMQRLVSTARWDADGVRDDLRDYVLEHLEHPQAVLVLDETGFLKQGSKSVGVKRQYSGTAGRIENCQIGVFLAYASPKGHAFIDRELYLPKEWAADAERRREAGVPDEIAFATKPTLALQMLKRAEAAGVHAAWVTGDEVYGRDRTLRMWLEAHRQPYVLTVACNEWVWVVDEQGRRQAPANEVASAIGQDQWHKLSAGEGAKGPRLYDWARVPLARLPEPGWSHWLLVRRSLSDPTELAYYVCFARTGASLEDLVYAAGMRWTIDDAIKAAKQETGLDEYEVRRWEGWYRHITLSLLAYAFLVVTRTAMRAADSGQKGGREEPLTVL